MALRRYRLIGFLFMSTLLLGLLWSCVEIFQTDRLSEAEDKRGRSLPAGVAVDINVRDVYEAPLSMESEFIHAQSVDSLPLRNARLPSKLRLQKGKKSLQAVYRSPEEDDSVKRHKQEPDAVDGNTSQRSSPTSETPQTITTTTTLSDKHTLDLLKDKKTLESRVGNDARELWWFLRAQLNALKNTQTTETESPETQNEAQAKKLETVVMDVEERYHTLRSHLKKLEGVSDDLFKAEWKQNLSTRLGSTMQRRLHYLQNPPDCSAAKKLVCNIAKTCGFDI